MKRLVIVLAAALAAVAVYAVTAPAGPQAVTPKQFASLQKRTTALEKKVKQMRAQLSCIQNVAPVGIFGDPNGSAGYAYHSGPGQDTFTTALDVSGQGERISFYAATVESACVSSAKFAPAKLGAPVKTVDR